jgi:hypothetical protein
MAAEIAARMAPASRQNRSPRRWKCPPADKVSPAVREALKGILADLDNGDIDGARARLNDIIT